MQAFQETGEVKSDSKLLLILLWRQRTDGPLMNGAMGIDGIDYWDLEE